MGEGRLPGDVLGLADGVAAAGAGVQSRSAAAGRLPLAATSACCDGDDQAEHDQQGQREAFPAHRVASGGHRGLLVDRMLHEYLLCVVRVHVRAARSSCRRLPRIEAADGHVAAELEAGDRGSARRDLEVPVERAAQIGRRRVQPVVEGSAGSGRGGGQGAPQCLGQWRPRRLGGSRSGGRRAPARARPGTGARAASRRPRPRRTRGAPWRGRRARPGGAPRPSRRTARRCRSGCGGGRSYPAHPAAAAAGWLWRRAVNAGARARRRPPRRDWR